MKIHFSCMAVILVLGLASEASAATISVSEPPDFDFGTPGTDVGTLDVGTNTISGGVLARCGAANLSTTANCGFFFPAAPDEDTRDTIQFALGSDLEVTAATFTVSNWSYTDVDISNGNTGQIGLNTLSSSGFTSGSLTDNGSFSILDNPGPIADTFSLGVEFSLFGNGELSAEWEIEIVVASTAPPDPGTPPAIPLPASLPLTLVGVGALGLVARRKHPKA